MPGIVSRFTNTQQPKGSDSNKPTMRKRHLMLGTMLIFGGSWITHTTTATIAPPDKRASYSDSIQEHTALTPPDTAPSLGVGPASNSSTISFEETTRVSKLETELEEPYKVVRHIVKKGESLGLIFRKKSLDLSLPYLISQHEIAKQLVSLSIGNELEFRIDSQEQLREIRYPISALERLDVTVDDNNVVSAKVKELPYITQQQSVSAEIESSLYLSALDAGLSNNMIMEMVRIFGWDIDFVLDIRNGDSFHVIYTEYHMDGAKLADGNILAAEFTTQGQSYRAIRFEDDEGNASFYTPEGESMLGTFLRSPVEFSRISSRFGRRKHPISKKWKTHKGVDYAASRGTPIRATADGKVSLAGRNGGYGNTVVLRHAGRFSTLYAHMKGFAKGVRAGARVKQGQVIGYVGTTGYSTGPHLHYEFRVDGVHRNSLTYKTPKASSVDENLKPKFDQLAGRWLAELSDLNSSYQLAKGPSEGTTL